MAAALTRTLLLKPRLMPFDEELARRVRDVLTSECEPVERRMFGGLAFMVGGHMCCGIIGQDLVIRVGGAEHDEALRQPHVRAMDFTGKAMKGFVYVEPGGTDSKASLRKWVRKGLGFVSQLPPK